jgi:para-nitrobenzyl esterase
VNHRITVLVALVTTFACGSSDENPSPDPGSCKTSVAEGPLAGLANEETCEYRGIPYAKPPVGALRFAPPEPAPGWTEERDARKFGAVCPGIIDGEVDGSEDCLYLNVYTPRTPSSVRLPVMVWIHGGGFGAGAGSDYDGRLLSEKGPVVVVTVNYRLGPFGYLNLPELDAARPGVPSGNDGIRDQRLALAWVQKNAAAFGGDPDNVTVFGESAGSLSTCMHLTSPGSRGLAQHFVLESGACVGFAGYALQPALKPSLSTQMATALCTGAAANDPLACLRSLDPETILSWKPVPTGPANGVTGAFGPIVEALPGAVMPDLASKIIAAGEYDKSADIIVGTTQHEAGLLSPPYIDAGLPVVTSVASFHDAVELYFTALTPLVEAQYHPADDAAAGPLFITLMTDFLMRCPSRTMVRVLRASGSPRVYLYSYDEGRAFHTDEIAALLPMGPRLARFQVPEPPPAIAEAMKGYWTRFAEAGDPNGDGAEPWPLYDEATDAHLSLADPPRAGEHLGQPACDFWDGFLKAAGL